ncbi:MAG: lysophospholipid acyltransferase family protein [bacterium]
MARLSHHIEYGFTWLGVKLAGLMSARAADVFGATLGRLAYILLASRRHIAYDNLRRSLGDTVSPEETQAIVRRVFENIGRTLIEFARFGRIKPAGTRKIVVGDGEEHLQQTRREGRGGLVVTAHFGNWELLGSWVAAAGYPMDFLVGTQHNQKVDRLFNDFRRQMGVGIVSLKTSARGVFKCLRANRIAGLVSDQHASSGGVVVNFLGRPAATPRGPAAFAIRAGCPLLPFLIRRERYDRHVVMAGTPVYPPNSGNEEKDIETMTKAYTKFFEDGIRRYPDQWMWTHRRWKL